MTPDSKPRRVLPTPRGALWLGIALIVVGVAAQWLVLLATVFQEQQNQPAMDAVFWVMRALQGVATPMGIAFVAFSFIARAVVRTETLEVDDTEDDEEHDPAPRAISSRVVLVLGIALVVIGFLVVSYLDSWRFAISGDPGLARDFVFYVAPYIEPVLLPLGILLIPCAWVLRLLESRSVLSAIR